MPESQAHSKLDNQELERLFAQGQALMDLQYSPGWLVLLDLMEKLVVSAEADLLNYLGSDGAILLSLQKRACAYRTFFHLIQSRVLEAIDVAQKVPMIAASEPLVGTQDALDIGGLDNEAPYVV